MRKFLIVVFTLLIVLPAYSQITQYSGDKGRGLWVFNTSFPTVTGGNSYPFINYAKLCTAFRDQSNGNAPWDYMPYLNTNGYFNKATTDNVGGNLTCGFPIPIQNTNYSGNYIIRWTGSAGTGGNLSGVGGVSISITGGITVNGSTTNVVSNGGGTMVLGGTNGSVNFTPPNGATGINLAFIGTAATPITIDNIEVIREDQQVEADAGEIFNPLYLNLLRKINPRVLRFLAWANINNNNRSLFEYTMPQSALTWWSNQLGLSHYKSSSVSYDIGSDTFTLSAPSSWGGLVDRTTVVFYNPTSVTTSTISGSVLTVNSVSATSEPITVGMAVNIPNSSGIRTGTIVGGSGYVDGTYTAVPLTNVNGLGSGAQATITVSGGAVTSVLITTIGSSYSASANNNVKSASNTNLGGSGSGFTYTITETWSSAGLYISSFGTGSGGVGTYNLNQTLATFSTPITYTVSARNSTTSPKVNVAGTGDIVVKTLSNNLGGNAIEAGTVTPGTYNTLVYNSLLNVWTWSRNGLTAEIPVSVQAALCNKLAKDCWFQVPNQFTIDAMSEWGAVIASYLDPSLRAFLEYSNENGTFGGGFLQTYWNIAMADAMGYPGALNGANTQPFYSIIARQMLGRIKSEWPVNRSQPIGVCAALVFQTFSTVANQRFAGAFATIDSGGLFTTGTNSVTATASQAGTTMTVTGTPSAPIKLGMKLNGVPITNFGTATIAGGAGTYTMLSSQTVSSGTQTLTPGGTGNAIVTDYSAAPNRLIDYCDITSTASTYYRGANVTTPSAGNNYIDSNLTQSALTITAITNTNPANLTVTNASSTYANGDRIWLNSSIGGLTRLQNTWATVANLGVAGSNRFDLTNCNDNSGNTISCDTTSDPTWTSGGGTQRVIPGLLTPVIENADKYASGDPELMRQALLWFSQDIVNGTRPNASGVPTNPGFGTFVAITNLSNSWASTVGSISGRTNLPKVEYEGAYDGEPIPVGQTGRAGISSDYNTKTNNLIEGWKSSQFATQNVIDLGNLFVSVNPPGSAPAWLSEVGPTDSEWALIHTSLYNTPYKTLDGLANSNAAPASPRVGP